MRISPEFFDILAPMKISSSERNEIAEATKDEDFLSKPYFDDRHSHLVFPEDILSDRSNIGVILLILIASSTFNLFLLVAYVFLI